jgi:hypothetical protein
VRTKLNISPQKAPDIAAMVRDCGTAVGAASSVNAEPYIRDTSWTWPLKLRTRIYSSERDLSPAACEAKEHVTLRAVPSPFRGLATNRAFGRLVSEQNDSAMMRLLALAILLIPATKALGQNFGGGVQVGFVSSQLLEFGFPTTYDKVGFTAGGFTDYRFTPNSTLQLELNFIQKGTRQAGTIKNENKQFGTNLNYLEVPVLYRWWGIKNMSVEIGPQLGVLLSATEWEDSRSFTFESMNYKSFHRIDFSMAAGLSYFFLRNRLEANARYSISAIHIRERAQGTGIWPAGRVYNSVFCLSVRWWFKNTYDAPPKAEKSLRTLE